MYGIIGAMKSEVEELIAHLSDRSESCYNGVVFHQGMLCGRIPAVIAESGVGKVNAAVTAVTMAERFHPRAIINTGVGGALAPELEVKDVALASALVQHDMDTSAIGDPVGLISGINVIELPADKALGACVAKAAGELGIRCVSGVIASGDQFVSSAERKRYIVDNFGAIACEMEGASIAQVCYVNRVRYVVIRAISDSADGSAHMDYGEFVKIAAANSAKILERCLYNL